MTKDIGNYARHAQYWDWGGHDRSEEHEYWLRYAQRYGKNVLIPMCAWGETGAYMAERGFEVTAVDITPEMIAQGRKHFDNIPGLRLLVGDVRDFHFDMEPADFCYSMDFGHLLSLEDVKRALSCIHRHLREGGCLVIETGMRMPDEKSSYHPDKTFYPLLQRYPGIKVWKTGETWNDARTGRCYISQTFYAQDEEGRIDSFDHAFYLQGYTREEWLDAFNACGFEVAGEYASRALASWQSGGDGFRIFEAVKRRSGSKDAAGMDLRHDRIDLDQDKDYVLERHCRINYACDTPWAREIPYAQYRAKWFAQAGQQEGFLSALRESMKDARTVAEIIRDGAGEIVGYLWAAFHREEASFVWMDVQDLYVEEACRGQGVAAYLMDYAERAARQGGARVIRSGTGSGNPVSQRLHARLGYSQYRMEYEKVL